MNSFKAQTVWDCFEKVVKSPKAKSNLFAYRPKLQNNKLADKYIWKTYEEVYNESLLFARGVDKMGLCPKVTTEYDGEFKFLGIYSRNRVEWMIADLGSHANSVTVVTIYDTLGDQAIEFILEQTQLTTVVIEEKGLEKILKLAKEKKVGKLQHLILLDNADKKIIDDSLVLRHSPGKTVGRHHKNPGTQKTQTLDSQQNHTKSPGKLPGYSRTQIPTLLFFYNDFSATNSHKFPQIILLLNLAESV